MSGPKVSVVVPTYNRLRRLQRVLTALDEQTTPRSKYEVIVVSDGSTDGTDEHLRAKQTDHFVFVAQENAGPAAARNRGVELARGDLVLFIDDDVIASPDLVEAHLTSHAEHGPDRVVIGPMLTPPDFDMTSWVRWEQAMLYKQYDAMKRGDYQPTFRQFYTGNASVPREELLQVGGFDVRFRRAEDVELSYRLRDAGLGFVFNPDAIGWHYAERPFQSWLQNAHDYGANDVIFARDHGRGLVLDLVRKEVQRRHVFVRWTTRLCLNHPWLDTGIERALKGVIFSSDRLRLRKVNQAALSGLYNLAYYRGMADELGGADAFLAAIEGTKDATPA